MKLEKLHFDTAGTFEVRSRDHSQHFVFLVDEVTQCKWTMFAKKKSYIPEKIVIFLKMLAKLYP